ncbi:MAG: Rpn family recombination-promoting nuclease/putative transposase [Lachnospiraceae bacterium]|nr:Rpn family recombination-promoting nuclease/putative transposase [Lachnospiraceae bacterium]
MASENHSTIASSEHAEHTDLLPETLASEDLLANATGPVEFSMTNDYLFKTFLQRNNKALKGLIASLLHLPVEQIRSVEVIPALDEGDSLTEKTLIMDLLVSFNNDRIINLEMQVINEHNWTDRSLTYLCRTFNHLNKGELYSQVRPVIQIGFLDFTLFPETPEFYATYRMLNIKNHTLYSSKITLSVVDLTRKDLATEEDKQYHIDYWTSFFKAETWEDIKTLAKQNEYIKEAAETVFKLTRDQQIRRQLEAREDFLRREREKQWRMETLTAEKAEAEQRAEKAENDKAVAEQRVEKAKVEIAELKRQAEASASKIAELMAEVAALKATK